MSPRDESPLDLGPSWREHPSSAVCSYDVLLFQSRGSSLINLSSPCLMLLDCPPFRKSERVSGLHELKAFPSQSPLRPISFSCRVSLSLLTSLVGQNRLQVPPHTLICEIRPPCRICKSLGDLFCGLDLVSAHSGLSREEDRKASWKSLLLC